MGEGRGLCYLTIEKGNIVAKKGTGESPDLTIETPFDVWMDIITHKADGSICSWNRNTR